LTLIGHHLSGDIHKKTLLLRDHLARSFVSVYEDELMDPVGSVSFRHSPLPEQSLS
jgi:hypothetical protein